MDYLKEYFESEGEKTHEGFQKWCKEKGYKLADLSKGEYELKAKAERLAQEKANSVKTEYEEKIKLMEEEKAKAEAEIAKAKAELAEKEAAITSTLSDTEKVAKEVEKAKADLEAKIAKMEQNAEKENQKYKSMIEKLQAENESAKQAGILAERKALYIEAGGKKLNLDRDISYLSNLINEETSFEQALENYKKDHPTDFTVEKGTVSTVPDLKGGDKEADADKMAAAVRKGAGLPEKT